MKKRIAVLCIGIFICTTILGWTMSIMYEAKRASGRDICVVYGALSKICEKPEWIPANELFYGEWEVTDIVYVNPIIARDVPPYTPEEMEIAGEDFVRKIHENGIEKIRFLQNTVMVNGWEKEDVIYEIVIFPSREYQWINNNMLLSEMGMTKDAGQYYAYVTADWGDAKKDGGASVLHFYIKDKDTLLVNYDSCCVEYQRNSYESGKDIFPDMENSQSKKREIPYHVPSYALFYGEWERTDRTYGDLSEHQRPSDFLIQEEIIQFSKEKIVINGEEKKKKIRYNIGVYAVEDDHKICGAVTLADIGLTKAEGSYYVYVQAEGIEENAESGNTVQLGFWIIDENTLVLGQGSYCVEYRRISYEGGSREPFDIQPLL